MQRGVPLAAQQVGLVWSHESVQTPPASMPWLLPPVPGLPPVPVRPPLALTPPVPRPAVPAVVPPTLVPPTLVAPPVALVPPVAITPPVPVAPPDAVAPPAAMAPPVAFAPPLPVEPPLPMTPPDWPGRSAAPLSAARGLPVVTRELLQLEANPRSAKARVRATHLFIFTPLPVVCSRG